MIIKKIVLNIPHSSVYVPSEVKPNAAMEAEIREKTDWFTDELFENCKETGFSAKETTAVFPYSRCYCDVERLIDDPLNAKGRGIVYDFGVEISAEDRYRRWFLYNQYRERLAALLNENHTLLIDCHSFADESEFDICLAFNDDDTRPDDFLLKLVRQYFEQHNLKVGINQPYSNSITIETPTVYQSLKIEINQRLYLDPQTKEKTDNFQNVKWILEGLYRRLKGDLTALGLTQNECKENCAKFEDNLLLFWQNRELIWSKRQYYYVANPFRMGFPYGCNHLGRLLEVWAKNPEVNGIYRFTGSPCSGACSWSGKGPFVELTKEQQEMRKHFTVGTLHTYFGRKVDTPFDVQPVSLRELVKSLKS